MLLLSRAIAHLGPQRWSAVCDAMSTSQTRDRQTNLIELGSHVQEVDSWLLAINSVEADKRVDFEVGKV